MKERNRKRGFTMAEMLIVVAIIGVLSAVAFVSVTQHQRDLERLDRDSVARELFIAAQNHLTMAKSQGYLGVDAANMKGNQDEVEGVFYFAVNKGDKFSAGAAPETLLDLMLPFGAIDETVRGGGSYIIRYHYDTATVMDVFYCSTDERYGYDLSGTGASTLSSMLTEYGEGKESARRNFNGKVLGWYGGETVETLAPEELGDPEIVVDNGAKLVVYVADGKKSDGTANPTTSSIQVVVKGVISKAEKVFTLKPAAPIGEKDSRIVDDTPVTIEGTTYDYSIILDDITTADMHFADLSADLLSFIPGEDITIQAKAFDNSKISNIGYSAEITVNSLFEKMEASAKDNNNNSSVTAFINNIRHLENLDRRVSNVSNTRTEGTGNDAIYYTLQSAVQTSDMSWSEFEEDVKNTNTDPDRSVYQHTIGNSDTTYTSAGCYLPVNPDYVLSYDGQNHSISNIIVNYAGDAGLFGELISDSSVSNLELINFSITATSGNAGALVGTMEQTTTLANDKYNVSNVLAINDTDATAVNVSAAGSTDSTKGHAGGLIGSATNCTVEKSAASLIVSSTGGDAGGLIGQISDGKVSVCYSGGHTTNAAYSTTAYNVTAGNGNAGGLIGVVLSSTTIENSYSTCSATGKVAGGFVATAVANISNCYATGLVCGTDTETKAVTVTNNGKSETKNMTLPKDGAFAYSLSGSVSGCYYYELINERVETEGITGGNKTYTVSATVPSTMTSKDSFTYLTALGGCGGNAGITALDATADSYDEFVGAPSTWTPAVPYDSKLLEYYSVKNKDDDLEGRFNLQNVERRGAVLKKNEDDTTAYFVATHYGDWPAPEIFVVNAAS